MIWKTIEHYDSDYSISSTGVIKSTKQGKQKILNQRISKDGYYIVDLRRTLREGEHEKKTFKVHRLIAMAFLPNPKGFKYVNHIDGNKLNNNVCNLEWCTSSHNKREAVRLKLVKLVPVAKYDSQGNLIKKYDSLSQVVEDGYKIANISANLNGRTSTAYGFKWTKI